MTVLPTFRRMAESDIPAVLELERATYPEPWSIGILTDELSQDNRIYLVAEVDGVLAGYAGLMLVEDDAHVTTLAVERHTRNVGLGTRLMLELVDTAVERGARNLTLEVRASNEGAQHLYEKFGMDPVGLRKHYYKGDDAVIMWATDIDQPEYEDRLAEIEAGLEVRT